MSVNSDPVKVMKREVGIAAASRVESDSIVGLGTGSTTAYAIEHLGKRLESGELKKYSWHSNFFSSRSISEKIRHTANNFRCSRSDRCSDRRC